MNITFQPLYDICPAGEVIGLELILPGSFTRDISGERLWIFNELNDITLQYKIHPNVPIRTAFSIYEKIPNTYNVLVMFETLISYGYTTQNAIRFLQKYMHPVSIYIALHAIVNEYLLYNVKKDVPSACMNKNSRAIYRRDHHSIVNRYGMHNDLRKIANKRALNK